MRISLLRGFGFAFVAIVSPTLLQAHPGHDGHELTWDLSHLAAYPLATMGCLAAVAAIVGVGWLMLRRSATARIQSLRGSQPSRGK